MAEYPSKQNPLPPRLGSQSEYRNLNHYKGKNSRNQSKYEYFPILIDDADFEINTVWGLDMLPLEN